MTDFLLQPGDPRLESVQDLRTARQFLDAFEAPTREQAATRDEILQFVDQHPQDAHLRSCLEGHLTASALIVSEDVDRVLLLHHRKLGRWLQPGGHCDGDANLAAVALRESTEECGIDTLAVDPRVIDVDIHEIPARPKEPAHLHLDVRFLVIAPRHAEPVKNHESNDLRWFDLDSALTVAGDDSVLRLVELAREMFRERNALRISPVRSPIGESAS